MPRFHVYEIVPMKMKFSKTIEADCAETALKIARERYYAIESEEVNEGPGDLLGNIEYSVELIPESVEEWLQN